MNLKCPVCGMQYESGKYCRECGSKLQEVDLELICPSCGIKTKHWKFCPECGMALYDKAAEKTKQPLSETLEAEQMCDAGWELVSPTEVTPSTSATDSTANSVVTSLHTNLPMDKIRRDVEADYSKPSLKKLAEGVLKIAEVIEERLPNVDVSYMIHPSKFAPEIEQNALPIHFLFKKDGVPKVAVVAVTQYGYRTPRVVATQLACNFHNIEYIRVYVDGTYAGWMAQDADPKKIEFCKDWLVSKILANL